jgi:hypothetical protein
VSGNDEYLPIVAGLVGAKGSGLILANLAKVVLEVNSWPSKVKTGRHMFELADNIRNVAVDNKGESASQKLLFEDH